MLLTNYITSAWRNILRHKLFSAINILGLAIGLAAVMLIALYVRYETSYDSFWKNADNIFRMHIIIDSRTRAPFYGVVTSAQILENMAKEIPEIKQFARIYRSKRSIIYNQNNYQENVAAVDRSIVDMFDFDTVYGDITNALNNKNGLVLTETLAEKYFGKRNAIGETVTINMEAFTRDYQVTAIIKDISKNSKLAIEAMVLLSPDDWEETEVIDTWYAMFVQSYFTVENGSEIAQISKKFPAFVERNFPRLPVSNDLKMSDVVTLNPVNIKNLHLKSVGLGEYTSQGSMVTVLIFSSLAILILFTGCINFINLSTARATRRAKEISLRKVVGAKRKDLIYQFLGESLLLASISMIIAITTIELTLPFARELLSKELTLSYDFNEIIYISILIIFVGLLGGIYPALILSKFRPSENLKSTPQSETKSTQKLRTILVVAQFSISITLFVSTFVIYNQMKYVDDAEVGYDPHKLLTIYGNSSNQLAKKINIIQSRFNNLNGVEATSWAGNFMPGTQSRNPANLHIENTPEGETIALGIRSVGYDFFKTYHIPITAGRTFDRDRRDSRPSREAISNGDGHTSSILINMSTAKKMGYQNGNDAIGQRLSLTFGQKETPTGPVDLVLYMNVIGVVPDIHIRNLKQVSEPEFFQLEINAPLYVNIRYFGDPQRIIAEAKEIWQQEMPNNSFNYEFAHEAMTKQYAEEQGQMTIFAIFACLAVFVACLGLFGLASFTAERRTKEIGIRKVFGAEVWQIAHMLVLQFSKPVLIANIIAWPIAYLAMSCWLESFVYRIDDMMIIALCLIAGLTALLIAWATVAGNSYAVARQNPIKALRYE